VRLITKFRLAAISTAVVTLVSIGAFGGSPGARAAEVPSGTAGAFLTVSGRVLGVAATSPSNAWAVGYAGYAGNGNAQMLIAHWNGSRWSLVPNLPLGEVMQISMDAPDDAWAIAETSTGAPFVIHWNGESWSQDTSVPSVVAYLSAVVVVAGQVWVSGDVYGSKGRTAQVMLHRTGGRWYVVPVPGKLSYLGAFAALSRTNIWAGGASLMHWNGAEWKVVPLPKSIGLAYVGSMATGLHGSVWALASNSSAQNFSLHWTGKAWTKVPFPPASGEGDAFSSIASVPGGTDWVVGSSLNSNGLKQFALILRWSGKAWQTVKAPSTTFGNVMLADVTATSSKNAWAVGVGTCIQEHCPVQDTLILHWNGKAWAN
jgi:hypothetical protein